MWLFKTLIFKFINDLYVLSFIQIQKNVELYIKHIYLKVQFDDSDFFSRFKVNWYFFCCERELVK